MRLSSEVIDSTESIRESSKMRSEAYFSRLKVKETSTEIYREMQSGTELGRFYKIKVLARIPKTEYERVQEWKKEQEDKREKIAQEAGAIEGGAPTDALGPGEMISTPDGGSQIMSQE